MPGWACWRITANHPDNRLLASSLAIDAGSNALANEYSLTTDQRGVGYPRIVNGTVDIGAFERPLASSIGPATAYTVDLTSDTGASQGADAGDLAYVIGQANINPNLAGCVIEFDPSVSARPTRRRSL